MDVGPCRPLQPHPRWWQNGALALVLLLMNCGGGGDQKAVIPDPPPSPTAPKLSSEPLIVAPGTPFFPVTFTGENFVEGSLLKINNRECPTTYLGPTRLSTWIPEVPLHGVYYQVKNPGPVPEYSAVVNAVLAKTVGPNSPAVEIQPTTILAGSGAFTLTFKAKSLDGSFDANAVAIWNGRPMPSTVAPDRMAVTATIPASEVVHPGLAAVALYEPGEGQGGMRVTSTFSIAVSLDAVDLVKDPLTDDLVALEMGLSTTSPNRLVKVNPLTGEKTVLASLGTPMTLLAFSTDGQYLYLGGPAWVHRYQWPSLTRDLTLALPNSSIYRTPLEAVAIIPVPGEPKAFLVAINDFPSWESEFRVYDDAVMRPNTITARAWKGQVLFGASSSQLFVYEPYMILGTGHSTSRLGVVSLDPKGLTAVAYAERLFSDGARDLSYWKGKLYADTFDVVDIPTLTRVTQGFDSLPDFNLLLLDPANGNKYAAREWTSGDVYVQTMAIETVPDQKTRGIAVKQNLHIAPNGPIHRFVRWGKRGLAVTIWGGGTGHGALHLLQSDGVVPFP